jgi:glutathione S-transferase
MIALHDYELSAECYKVRLMLGLLGLEWRTVPVDYYPGAEHKTPAFRTLSPLGRIPVLEDDGFTLHEPHAILIYLAGRYDPSGRWSPHEPQRAAEIAQWLAFAGELGASAGGARRAEGFFEPVDADAARAEAHRLFRILDEHLWFGEREGRDWLCPAERPTIADIACFPAVALSEEGGVSRQDYPAIRRWMDRVKRVPGFSVMSGVFPAAPGR